MTNRDDLIKLLKKKFPNCWFKEGELFNSSNKDSIWSGEGSTINGMNLVNDYAQSSKYTMGVHIEMNNFLEKHGWYHELYDSGTVFFYKS